MITAIIAIDLSDYCDNCGHCDNYDNCNNCDIAVFTGVPEKDIAKEEGQHLSLFERWNTESYLTESRYSKKHTIFSRVQSISDRFAGQVQYFTQI